VRVDLSLDAHELAVFLQTVKEVGQIGVRHGSSIAGQTPA
jgi:hypothetical protein